MKEYPISEPGWHYQLTDEDIPELVLRSIGVEPEFFDDEDD